MIVLDSDSNIESVRFDRLYLIHLIRHFLREEGTSATFDVMSTREKIFDERKAREAAIKRYVDDDSMCERRRSQLRIPVEYPRRMLKPNEIKFPAVSQSSPQPLHKRYQ